MATRNMVLAALLAALLAIGSQISFLLPGSYVPHTLQVFFVMLTGMMLGSRWGFTSIAVWVLLGTFGLPVFAQGKAGIVELIGPTGGFKVGFMLCGYLVGRLTENADCGFRRSLAAMLFGLIIVYAVGFAGFMLHFNYFQHKLLTLSQGLGFAVIPFLPYDIVKTLFAASIGVKVKKALMRSGLISSR